MNTNKIFKLTDIKILGDGSPNNNKNFLSTIQFDRIGL